MPCASRSRLPSHGASLVRTEQAGATGGKLPSRGAISCLFCLFFPIVLASFTLCIAKFCSERADSPDGNAESAPRSGDQVNCTDSCINALQANQKSAALAANNKRAKVGASLVQEDAQKVGCGQEQLQKQDRTGKKGQN